MSVYQFEDRVPKIGASSYVSKAANVIGDVTIGEGCFIGPGAQIKGDYGTVKIGDNTSVQENVSTESHQCLPRNVSKIISNTEGSGTPSSKISRSS